MGRWMRRLSGDVCSPLSGVAQQQSRSFRPARQRTTHWTGASEALRLLAGRCQSHSTNISGPTSTEQIQAFPRTAERCWPGESAAKTPMQSVRVTRGPCADRTHDAGDRALAERVSRAVPPRLSRLPRVESSGKSCVDAVVAHPRERSGPQKHLMSAVCQLERLKVVRLGHA